MNIKSQNPIRIILFLLFSICMHGQIKMSNFYFGAKVGSKNGIGNSKQYVDELLKLNYEAIFNFGSGHDAEFFVGYQLKKNIGIEMGINYFYNNDDYVVTTFNGLRKFIDNFSSKKILQCKPSVVFKTDFKRLNPYLKVGPNIELNADISFSQIFMANEYTYTTQFNSTAGNKYSIGHHENVGVEIKITKNFSVFSEFSYSFLKIKNIGYLDEVPFHIEVINGVPNTNPELGPSSEYFGLERWEKSLFNLYGGSNISINNYGFDFGIKYQL